MSGSLSTPRAVSGSIDPTYRLARLGPIVDRNTTDDIFYHAAKANGSLDPRHRRNELNEIFESYNKTLPFAPEPSLMNVDFSIERLVGRIHRQGHHYTCEACSKIYIRFAYYPYTTHESHQTAVFCIEYRMRNPSGRDERASQSHLQLYKWSFVSQLSSSALERLVDSLNLGEGLQEYNTNLALSMAAELWRQARATHQYTYRRSYEDLFINVESEVERFRSFWEELKDDVCHHLFTEQNTYFDSRDIGLFM